MSDLLIEQLVRLPEEQVDAIVKKARAERQRRVRDMVCQVRQTLLSDFSARKAAGIIADAVQYRHVGSDPVLRGAVERQLIEALGHLDDIPAEARIRQFIAEQRDRG